MDDRATSANAILVVGAGMAAHGFVARVLSDAEADVRITVIGDEGEGPYDRAAVTGVLLGEDPARLRLDRSVFRDDRVRLIRDDRVLRIDRRARTVRTRSRRRYSYDTLVLATGSSSPRPAVEGAHTPGCFVIRTMEDAEAVRAFVRSRALLLRRPLRGAVIGGGFRGVQAADALQRSGVRTTVVQRAERLLPAQLDPPGAGMVRDALEAQGITVRTRSRVTRVDPDESGAVASLEFLDGSFQRADVVVFAVGDCPRDELAQNAGLAVHPWGGVVVDDRCVSSDPDILVIGEAACVDGRTVDGIAATRATAEVAAGRVLGRDDRLPDQDESAHRILAGIPSAIIGEPLSSRTDLVDVVVVRDADAGVYRKLVLSDDARTLAGAILVGDTGLYEALRSLSTTMTGAGLADQLRPQGEELVGESTCAHLGRPHDRLRAAARAEGLSTFTAIGARYGWQRGCERCVLAIARVLAELAQEDETLVGRSDAEDGLPTGQRIPPAGGIVVLASSQGAELVPTDLTATGRIAEEFGLQPRIVGGRIELHGVRPEQRARVQERLTAAGLLAGEHLVEIETPHATTSAEREEGDQGPIAPLPRGARQRRRASLSPREVAPRAENQV